MSMKRFAKECMTRPPHCGYSGPFPLWETWGFWSIYYRDSEPMEESNGRAIERDMTATFEDTENERWACIEFGSGLVGWVRHIGVLVYEDDGVTFTPEFEHFYDLLAAIKAGVVLDEDDYAEQIEEQVDWAVYLALSSWKLNIDGVELRADDVTPDLDSADVQQQVKGWIKTHDGPAYSKMCPDGDWVCPPDETITNALRDLGWLKRAEFAVKEAQAYAQHNIVPPREWFDQLTRQIMVAVLYNTIVVWFEKRQFMSRETFENLLSRLEHYTAQIELRSEDTERVIENAENTRGRVEYTHKWLTQKHQN